MGARNFPVVLPYICFVLFLIGATNANSLLGLGSNTNEKDALINILVGEHEHGHANSAAASSSGSAFHQGINDHNVKFIEIESDSTFGNDQPQILEFDSNGVLQTHQNHLLNKGNVAFTKEDIILALAAQKMNANRDDSALAKIQLLNDEFSHSKSAGLTDKEKQALILIEALDG